jgi:Skp family chaperone for outer membrane proteins
VQVSNLFNNNIYSPLYEDIRIMFAHRTTRTAVLMSFMTSVFSIQASAPAKEIMTTPIDDGDHVIKIRVINSSEAMQVSEFGKQEAQKIEALGKELKETIDKKEQQLMQTMNDLKTKLTAMTPEAAAALRDKEEGKIQSMRRDLESTGQASDDQYKRAVQRATEKLSKEIEQAVTKIAQEQNIDLVFDLYTGRPVYASNDILVTEDIIKVMDSNFGKAQKTAKKPAEPKAMAQGAQAAPKSKAA